MAKPIVKFYNVGYEVGPAGATYTGFRPQLELPQAKSDEAFMKEVIDDLRMSMTPNQLLYAFRCVIAKGMEKTCADCTPRVVTDGTGKNLFKFMPLSNGNLPNLTSAWDPATCNAYVRAQVFADSKKIDAAFQNRETGVGVKIDNVTYAGAQSVVNVVKTNTAFSAYGRNVQFSAQLGDTAKLVAGTAEYPLTATASDVACTTFSWPAGFAPEVGTVLVFELKSHGGVEGGELYTNTKKVTVVA